MRKGLTKELITEGKQEFAYINECYADLVYDNFDTKNYQNVFDNTEETLEYLVLYEINVKCFFNIESNEQTSDPELRCYYRMDVENLPKIEKILHFKRGIKFLTTYKGQESKSKLLSFTTFAKFTKTFDDLICKLKIKFLNKGYC